MMRARLGLCLLLASVSPQVAGAQEEPISREDLLVQELAGIRQSLTYISTLLDSVLQQQGIDVLMKRLQLKESRIAPLERELRAVRDDREALGEEVKRMRVMLEDWEREAQDRDPSLPEDEDMNRELLRLRRNIEFMEEREATLYLRIIELDNDLSRSRSDIRILEESVDEQLGLR